MQRNELLREVELALGWKEGSIDVHNFETMSFELSSMSTVLLLTYFDTVGLVVDPGALGRCQSSAEILELVGRENFQD